MAQIKVTVLKDSERYFGDVQRKARTITNYYFNIAKRKHGKKAKQIHPEKALRLAKKEVDSFDHVISTNISDEVAANLSRKELVTIGHDYAKGRRFNVELIE